MEGKERYRGRLQTTEGAPPLPDILTRLDQAVGAIQDSETFRQYLEVQARFHRYSFGNVALILAQRPDATQVAGYNAWLRMHRYVRRGETGIRIIVPMRRPRKADQEQQQDETKEAVFFGTGTVFDLSQTEGEPLPTVEVPVLEGGEGRGLYERMEDLSHRERVSVRIGRDEELGSNRMGFYNPTSRAIVIREAAQSQKTKTLAHELGHHFGATGFTQPENEAIAEAVAYVVCSHFGIDTSVRSIPYIATWSQERPLLRAVLGIVQRVSARIIDGVAEPSGVATD